MNRFSSAREAKEFLVSKIVDEAQREGIPLSEVERKMLYFSETYWTLPDMMKVSNEFDREYDQNEYEKKIRGLAKTAMERCHKESPEEYDMWQSAIHVLKKEDHYILVMFSQAGFGSPTSGLSPWYKGLVALIGLFFFMGFAVTHNFVPNIAIGIWIVSMCVMVVYSILRMIFGAKRTDSAVSKLFRRAFRKSAS
jgi:hypothetical protein